MANLGYVVAGAAALTVVGYFLYQQSKNGGSKNPEDALCNAFGDPMVTGHFSMTEATGWISARSQVLEQGGKALIMDANESTLRTLGLDVKIGDEANKFLVMAIVSTQNKSVMDKVLIKYSTLDENLKKSLANGNGVLVVGV